MSDKKQSRRVVIIGNGFDLNLGFKTSFRDYLNSSQFQSLSNSNTLAEFIRGKQRIDENWCDLEGALPEWTAMLAKKGTGVYATASRSTNSHIPSPEDEFDEFGESILNFLSHAVPNRYEKNYRTGVLMSHWGRSATLTVFNFNYTNSFEHYASLVPRDSFTSNYSHHYVHGTLVSGIVVGSDKDERIGDKRFVLKSTSADYEPPNNFHSELDQATHIDIFGHSLGNSDRSYFEPLFKRLLEDGRYSPKVRIFTKDRKSSRSVRAQASSFIADSLPDLHTANDVRFIQVEELSDWDFNSELSK